jgi:hypothetical protein
MEERILEILIASTPIEDFQRDLLRQAKGYKLKDAIAEGRRYEAIIAGRQQLKQMTASGSMLNNVNDQNVDAIRNRPNCGNCGTSHAPRKCPAYDDICKFCKKKGHWLRVCRQRIKKEENNSPRLQKFSSGKKGYNRKMHEVKPVCDSPIDTQTELEDEACYHTIWVSSMESNQRQEIFAELDVIRPEKKKVHKIRLKVDTGASGNTLPLRTFRQMYGDRSPSTIVKPEKHTRLTAYNGQEIPCMGSLTLELRHKDEFVPAKFYVVDVDGPPIVGLPTIEKLKLVTVHCNAVNLDCIDTIEDLKKAFPEQFDNLGNFKEPAQLRTKPDAEPFVDPPRKCSIHLKDKLREELEKMEKQGVIRKVTEHTDWCSSLAYSVKKDGSLRICIDPQKLNNALKRCPHKVPTLEEINPQFAGSSVFSKLDAKAGYWSVPLDADSQLLTTFRTPFGRYCWQRLPFGLRVSQDLFQARMDEILEDLPGVVGITDDVCVHGKDKAEHDENLKGLMERAKECGLVFNSEKCHIGQAEIEFFGNIYSKDGIRPSPDKVQGIQHMPIPQDKEDLQRFLGMMTYMSAFIPNFSKESQPLRELLKKDVPFHLDEEHIRCIETLKINLSSETCLKFFDPKKPTVLEVDSSMKGLGAALLQDGQPVAFASKSLDATQSNYPNIDREMLAVVFGITRFHTYLYGRPFTVITDHKPLEMIVQKPLLKAPPRLQRMLQKIQGYDFRVEYRAGKQMTLADALSRLPSNLDSTTIDMDLRVDGMNLSEDEITFCEFDFISFAPKKQFQLREATKSDHVLKGLMEIIINGWPERINQLPTDIKPYWSFRDELAIEDGIIFKGQQVIIPECMRADVLQQLHQSHQGVEKTRLLSQECAYWPNIHKDIEDLVRSCGTCQEFAHANAKEPLIPHETPDHPWSKIAADLFEIKGKDYLLICDYFSKYPIVTEMSSTSSEAVTEEMEKTVAMFGRPDIIISDNAQQFQGKAFQDFIQRWGIQHVTSSPRYPQSNGFIERQVQTVKKTIKKSQREGKGFHIAMLNLRATPVDTKLPSPAKMLLGRPIATLLPSRLTPGPETHEHRRQLEHRRDIMKDNFDKHARASPLPPLHTGQDVRVLDKQKKTWSPAQVVSQANTPRSYNIRTEQGSLLRRNRGDLRERERQAENWTLEQPYSPGSQLQQRAKTREDNQVQTRCASPTGKQQTNTPYDNNKEATLEAQQRHGSQSDVPVTTRSGREIRKPSRFRETP